MRGIIVKIVSNEYTVKCENEYIICKPLGIFRYQNMVPKVGDYVMIEKNTIIAIEERKNDLIRPYVANIDKVFIMTSLTEPSLNLHLLDRLLVSSEWLDLHAVLLFTKADLVNLEEYQEMISYYEKIGYTIYILPRDMESIKKEISGCVCTLAGQSGVGKSTFVNHLNNKLNLKTDVISKALGRGKHTTRHTELLEVANGYIVDTPGFGTLDLDMSLQGLADGFREFFQTKCKFSSCLHLNEPGCKVKEKVQTKEIRSSRYENYLAFVQEIKQKKKY